MEGFIGEIRGFAGNFAPRSWAYCDGSLLAISSNTALFSIIGTTYGGNGTTTFALPDMRGRSMIGPRTGPGLQPYQIGQRGGYEFITLTNNELPPHTHLATVNVRDGDGDKRTPGGNMISGDSTNSIFTDLATNSTLRSDSVTVGQTGAGADYSNRNPFLACNYIICLYGTFPSRS